MKAVSASGPLCASGSLLAALIGPMQLAPIASGVSVFVEWYRSCCGRSA